MNLRRILGTVAGLAIAAVAGGCAQQVGDIDRVDDNLLPKSMFDGQWYMVQTVVDTNATATYTFAGLQGPLERVHFEFAEDWLLARRVHEDIMGLDLAATNVPNQPDFDGSIVAGYMISSHSDVQRSYNSATGEETNVISENRSDRRWYERDFVRMNWNNNLVETNANGEFSSYIENMGAQLTIAAQENDGTLQVEYDEDGEAYYFDFVTTYIAATDWWNCLEHVGFPSWGTDCGTEEIVVRTSFLKVDTDDVVNTHVPRRYDDWDMGMFGFFRTNRCYFDERYECTDFSRIQMANVHDIWNNDRYEDGTPRPYYERAPNPIAYHISEEYPIDLIDEAYEIAEQYSYAFRRAVAAAQDISIDEVPRMFYACLNPGSTDATVPAEYLELTRNEADRQLLIEAYAASAEGYQNGECGEPGVVKNQGDIRYNFFNWRTDPAAPWYGYGPSATDPLTGEIIQGVANFNGGHLNRHAQRIVNYVKIIGGDLTAEEYGYAVPIQEYFENLRQQADYDLYYGLDLFVDDDDKDLEIQNQAAVNVRDLVRRSVQVDESIELAHELTARPHLRRLLEQPAEETLVRRNGRQADPLARAVGTDIEQMAMVPEFVEHMSVGQLDPNEEVTDEEWLQWVSPIRVAQMTTVENRYERLRQSWMEQNILMAPDFDWHIVGFAEEMYRYKEQLEATYPDLTPEEIETELWLEVRGRLYTGIQAHEIGHTVGFRHNFISTADSMNYFPQYWALRQQTFDNDCDGDGVRTFDSVGYAAGEVAPALCEGSETAEQTAERSAQILANLRSGVLADGTQVGSIDHYEYTTVMDYHGEFNGRQGGLGLYDYAAIAYGYAEMVERFNEPPHRLNVLSTWDPQSGDWQDTTVERDADLVTDMDDVEDWVRRLPGGTEGDSIGDDEDDNPWTYWHYSVLPIMFYDDASQVPADLAATYHPDHIDFTGVDAMARMYDRSLVSASDCHGGDCDYCDTDGDCNGGTCYRNPLDPRRAEGLTPGFCVADAGPDLLSEADVRVPYRFCSDFLRGSSALCNIFDSGADEFEVVTRIIEDYNNYYPISAFRRGRPAFGLSLWPYVSRQISYTFGPAIAQYQFWLLNASNRGPEWYLAERGGMHATIGMEDALNFVSGVWTTPTVGTYAPDLDAGGMIVNVDTDEGHRYPSFDRRFGGVAESDYIDLGVDDGARYGYTQFYRRREDDEAGYYYFMQYDVLSHFWTKYAALAAFMDGSVEVMGADTSSDNTAYYIPPYLAFPNAVGNHMGAIIAEDFGNFGACVTEGPDGEWQVDNIDLLRSSNYSCGGTVMNPYTAVYGNRDYNMKLYSTIWSAAYFSSNLDYSWLDHSSVYVWGRGETPAFINDRDDTSYDYITYTDERGVTYAARYLAMVENPDYDSEDPLSPEMIPVDDPDDANSDFGPNVGYRMIERAIDLQVEMDTVAALEEEAESNPAIFLPDRDSTEIYYELQNHLEIVRFLVETNKVFQW